MAVALAEVVAVAEVAVVEAAAEAVVVVADLNAKNCALKIPSPLFELTQPSWRSSNSGLSYLQIRKWFIGIRESKSIKAIRQKKPLNLLTPDQP